MTVCCNHDDRRELVRAEGRLTGIDYVELSTSPRTLQVFFLGDLPKELQQNRPGIEKYLRITGGRRVTGINITDIDPVHSKDPEKDDYLQVRLDRAGDFSTYQVELLDLEDIDPRYTSASFSFKVDCPSDLDCMPACDCVPAERDDPEINYLAKDYVSFRQLLLDRMSVLVPDWSERHVPDIGITLVELLAYAGDYLSYFQDAVATEAYLDTARQRISVRRHARLIDYRLHEGCNSRAWLYAEVTDPVELDPAVTSFITGLNEVLPDARRVLDWDDLRDVDRHSYEVFEPVMLGGARLITFRPIRNELHFYTWGRAECCLETGSTSAVVVDAWMPVEEEPDPDKSYPYQQNNEGEPVVRERQLNLQAGDVLVFEEVVGPKTGKRPDADPARRHVVRLTRVTELVDPLIKDSEGNPTPLLEVEWGPEDALPFTFCLSTVASAPGCPYIENVSVARGNVILVDHGRSVGPKDLDPVPVVESDPHCCCPGREGEIRWSAGRFEPELEGVPLTFTDPVRPDDPGAAPVSAAALFVRDVPNAQPCVAATTEGVQWEPRYDLLESSGSDEHFVVEIDDEGVAHLRFGNGELGRAPSPGAVFRTTHRIGNGLRGNVGAESITRLVFRNFKLDGAGIGVRNPLPAAGGIDAESVDTAKLFAPHTFRNRIERAIVAADYEQIAERHPGLQQAAASLVWTGSWYEADVAVDPVGGAVPDGLPAGIARWLEPYRRIGHDLHVLEGARVPIHLALTVCVRENFDPGQVKAELLGLFGNRALPGGKRGFFHPDRLTFGEGVFLSRIVAAAQAVAGVRSVRVVELNRRGDKPNHEIDLGVLALSTSEIAQLDNDSNFPERGTLEIRVLGGFS